MSAEAVFGFIWWKSNPPRTPIIRNCRIAP
jgi:hypothetical protein